MNPQLTPELIHQADSYLDRDDFHQTAVALGEQLFAVFGSDRKGQVSSQLRNLQQMVISATRFADIEDFVKNQMGRNAGAYREWRQVGNDILRQLGELREAADRFTPAPGQALLLRLYLARGWVRAVVGAYLYAKAQKEMEQSYA
jgi:hypothetical protein